MTPGPNPTSSATLTGFVAPCETPKRDLFGVCCNSRGDITSNRDLCREHGVAEPLIEVSESWVTTTFRRPVTESEEEAGDRSALSRHQVTAQVDRNLQEYPNTLSNNMLQILLGCLEDLTAQVTAQVIAQVVWHCRLPRFANEIMEFLGLKHRKTFRVNYLQPLMEAGWLEMTIPDKPTSSKQKYRLTDKGQQLLAELGEDDV